MFRAITQAYGRYRTVKNTERELNRLSDRDLKDLGITRYDIRRIAAGTPL